MHLVILILSFLVGFMLRKNIEVYYDEIVEKCDEFQSAIHLLDSTISDMQERINNIGGSGFNAI